MTREVSENADGQGRWTDNPRGPTYADACDLARELERQYTVSIHFRVWSDARGGPWQGTACGVDAIALAIRGTKKGSVTGRASFGSSRGSRTMPGAWVAALYDLEERLTSPETEWVPAMYPHS